MIATSGRKQLSAGAWRQIVHAAIEQGDLEEAIRNLVARSKTENGAAELVLRYTVGTPYRASRPTERLELPSLDTAQGCVEALDLVLQAHCNGEIGAEQATTYREMISAAAAIHRGQVEKDLEEALLAKGSTPVYPKAGEDPVESFARVYRGGDN